MNKKEIGNFIALKRKEKNFTQLDLANEIGVDASTVSHWERGRSYPDVELFGTIAEALGVQTIEVLNGRETVPTDNIDELNLNAIKLFKDFFERKLVIKQRIIIGFCIVTLLFGIGLGGVYYSEKPYFDIEDIYSQVEEGIKVEYFDVVCKGRIRERDIEQYEENIRKRWKNGNYGSGDTGKIMINYYRNEEKMEWIWNSELYTQTTIKSS